MPITNKHPLYLEAAPTWKKIRAVIAGNAKDYVPDIVTLKPGTEHYRRLQKKCEEFRNSGIFVNYSLQTKTTLVGVAFNEQPHVELPDDLEYIKDSATSNNLSLKQLAKRLVGEVIEIGRVGIYVDFPMVEELITAEQQQRGNFKAKFNIYFAEDIEDWEVSADGTQFKWIKLREVKTERDPDDQFSTITRVQWRILEINGDGVFQVSVMDKNEDFIIPPFIPHANGQPLTEIPFMIGGSEDNDEGIDPAPIETIIDLNIGHFVNSCAYESNLRKFGQPTGVVTSSHSPAKFKEMLGGRDLSLSNDDVYFLGQSGDIKLVSIPSNPEAAAAMTQKEQQMIQVGANIITASAANAPVETTRMVMSARVSTMETVIDNVEILIRTGLRWVALYMGSNDDGISYNMSRVFIKRLADPNVMQALLGQSNSNILPKSVLWDYNRDVGIIDKDKTNEEIEEELQNENPLL
jgi:hypothetical protein